MEGEVLRVSPTVGTQHPVNHSFTLHSLPVCYSLLQIPDSVGGEDCELQEHCLMVEILSVDGCY